jgi:hypothetical protein
MGRHAIPEPERWADRLVRSSPAVSRAAAYAGAMLVVAPFFYHLARGSKAYLGLLEDDFFYYSIIADKLVTLGKLTFDTSTVTNGFHPLWFVVLLAIRVLTGALGNAFYVVLSFVFLGSMIASYELSRVLARALGAPRELAAAIAAIPSIATDCLVSTGMETALDVPLILWLFIEVARSAPITPARAAKLGLVSSLAILARLDIGLAVALVLLGWLVFARPRLSTAVPALLAFCGAGSAVPLYAAFNWLVFGSVLPMSALAKQLVLHAGINLGYLRSIAFTTPYGHLAGVVLALGALAAWAMWRRRSFARPEPFFAAAAALAFAALFFGLNSLSGWMYFGWYAYPFAPALVAAMVLLGQAAALGISDRLRSSAAAAVVAAGAALTSLEGVQYFVTHGPLWSVEDNGLLGMSVQLSHRMRGHDGRYAMGAIGGFVAYELDKPLMQLEGLVSDRAMIEHIRHEDDLGKVLDAYRIDYLVVSLHTARMEEHDGCYVVTQPHVEWAGKRTAKMRGEICTPPVAHFVNRTPEHAWSIFNTLETFVFDVRGGRWRGSRPSAEAQLRTPPATFAPSASP